MGRVPWLPRRKGSRKPTLSNCLSRLFCHGHQPLQAPRPDDVVPQFSPASMSGSGRRSDWCVAPRRCSMFWHHRRRRNRLNRASGGSSPKPWWPKVGGGLIRGLIWSDAGRKREGGCRATRYFPRCEAKEKSLSGTEGQIGKDRKDWGGQRSSTASRDKAKFLVAGRTSLLIGEGSPPCFGRCRITVGMRATASERARQQRKVVSVAREVIGKQVNPQLAARSCEDVGGDDDFVQLGRLIWRPAYDKAGGGDDISESGVPCPAPPLNEVSARDLKGTWKAGQGRSTYLGSLGSSRGVYRGLTGGIGPRGTDDPGKPGSPAPGGTLWAGSVH